MAKIDLLIVKAQDTTTSNNGVLKLGIINRQEEKYLLKCYVKENKDGVLIIESLHDTYDKTVSELTRIADEYPNSDHDVSIIVDDNFQSNTERSSVLRTLLFRLTQIWGKC